jgi:chromosome segregation ATPase
MLKEIDDTKGAMNKAEQRLLATVDKHVARGLAAIRKWVAEEGISGVYGPIIELFDVAHHFEQCVETTAANRCVGSRWARKELLTRPEYLVCSTWWLTRTRPPPS